MRIGGIGYVYPTYVYNPNTVSAYSLNKLSRISDDVLDKKTEYARPEPEEENQNPLRKGQTRDFEGILAKQMQQGQSRAARMMTDRTFKEPVKTAESEQITAAMSATGNNTSVMQMQRAMQAYGMSMIA